MDKLTREEWQGVLHDTALAAAEDWGKYTRSKGWRTDELGRKGTYDRVMEHLAKQFPYDAVANDDMLELKDLPASGMWKWALGLDRDPRILAKEKEAAKFLPLLAGAAEKGEDWYSMGGGKLKMKAAEEFGYPYTQEGFAEFLDKLSEYQGDFDRGKLLDEMRSSAWYIPTKLAYPSMTEYFERAIAEGSDVDNAKVAELAAIDAGAAAGIVAAPGMPGVRALPSPMEGVAGAALQGLFETGRQAGAAYTDEGAEFDASAPFVSAGMGFTRPGMLGTVQALTTRVPGRWARDFTRGISKSSRAGDPTVAEEEELARTIRDYTLAKTEGEIRGNHARALGDGAFGIKMNVTPKEYETITGAQERAPEILKLLGFGPADRPSTAQVLERYRKTPAYTMKITPEGKFELADFTPKFQEGTDDAATMAKFFQLNKANADTYKRLFPAKYADEVQSSPWRLIGLRAGQGIGYFGGRVEPAIKVNPLGVGPSTFKDYKDEAWYKRLSADQKKVVDSAMKEKEGR